MGGATCATSIISSAVDTGEKLLQLCEKNVHRNIESLGGDLIPGRVGGAQ